MAENTGREFLKDQEIPVELQSTTERELKTFLETLVTPHEEVTLPSRGLFYDGAFADGKAHVRCMTMKEEKILATQRLVRSGKALDMIFEQCLQEKFPAQDLISQDRTFLLIWLRGISYGPEYEVQIKCPSCSNTFPEEINLSDLPVEFATDDMVEPMSDVLPRAKAPFQYRLMRGRDEISVAKHRERKAKAFGDEALDDTLMTRDLLLLDSVAGFTDRQDITRILERLSMEDAAYIRDCINNPGFGVDTKIPLGCPYCAHDFQVELPMDTNFFFPQGTKKHKSS